MAGDQLELRRAYPLHWPVGRRRTAERKPALFKHDGRSMTLTAAERRLLEQVDLLSRIGKPRRTDKPVLSSNIRYTASGGRDRNVSRYDPADPGASVAFDLDGAPVLLACDQWNTVADNIAAIAAHIEALRGQERWGVATLKQAFAGHVALPAPEQWWQVLGVAASATTAEVDVAWRALAAAAHPDRGGSDQAMARLNAARDDSRRTQA